MKTVLKLILLYLGYQLLAGAALVAVGHLAGLTPATQLAASLLLSGAAMAAHLVAGGYVDRRRILRPVSGNAMLGSLVCIIAAMLCCNALGALIPLPNWMEADFTALSHSPTGILSIALVAPVTEELLFRGAILTRLQGHHTSPWRGITLSALIFGLIHINPAQVLAATLMGLALGWVTAQTHSLIPAIAGHVLNNTLSIIEIVAADNTPSPFDPSATPTHELMMMAAAGLAAAIVAGRKITHLVELEKEE